MREAIERVMPYLGELVSISMLQFISQSVRVTDGSFGVALRLNGAR